MNAEIFNLCTRYFVWRTDWLPQPPRNIRRFWRGQYADGNWGILWAEKRGLLTSDEVVERMRIDALFTEALARASA